VAVPHFKKIRVNKNEDSTKKEEYVSLLSSIKSQKTDTNVSLTEQTKSITTKPNSTDNLYNAQVLFNSGKLQAAVILLNQLVSTEPENSQAWLFLGFMLAKSKDIANAEKCFLQAKKLNHPQSEQAIEWLRSLE